MGAYLSVTPGASLPSAPDWSYPAFGTGAGQEGGVPCHIYIIVEKTACMSKPSLAGDGNIYVFRAGSPIKAQGLTPLGRKVSLCS